MTDTQLVVILGTIWIAPHGEKWQAQLMVWVFMLIIVCKHLGWI